MIVLAYASITGWYISAIIGGICIAIVAGWGWQRE